MAASQGADRYDPSGTLRANPAAWRWLIAAAGTALAFWLGYVVASNFPLTENWYQRHLSPALNYACTGHFARVRMGDNATPEDASGWTAANDFLFVRRPDFPCSLFPRHLAGTSVLDGFDSSNVDQPIYLMLSYGLLWRWLGPEWSSTSYVVGALVAISFLLLYLCAARFMPAPLAAAVILLFLSSPFFIRNVLSPRDALKIPFVVAIIALLVGYATWPRRPLGFVAFAAGIGLLIGIGYGFRSDLLLFIAPAIVIIAVLGRVEFRQRPLSRAKAALTNVAIRAAAIIALLASFVAGGWLPLLNDYYLNPHNRDIPYHALGAGLYGITDGDLFQRPDLAGPQYMFRNAYNNDVFIGLRVLEYASRTFDDADVPWAQARYWTYAKRFYLAVAGLIPADMISHAIGAFVHLMAVPSGWISLVLFDPAQPWADTYSFARGGAFFDWFARPMDRMYAYARARPAAVMLTLNFAAAFAFLCLIATRLSFRSAAATVILLGIILFTASLRFELRHVFYIYMFPVLAWSSTIWLLIELFAGGKRTRRINGPAAAKYHAVAKLKAAASVAAPVAALVLGVFAAVYLALSVARTYQAANLRSLALDWLGRTRIPVQFDVDERPDGMTFLRVRSPLPTSVGTVRRPDDPVTTHVQMAVIAVEIDGGSCAGRLMKVGAIGEVAPTADTAFHIWEDFKIKLESGTYVAFLPAFFWQLGGVTMALSGIWTQANDVKCIRGLSAVTEFKKNDILFDFLLPADPAKLKNGDFFQRVLIPGLGNL